MMKQICDYLVKTILKPKVLKLFHPLKRDRVALVMKKITRRDFIKLSTGSAMALGTSHILNGCGKNKSIVEPTPNAQINAHVAAKIPDLTIIDFSICVEGDGPTTGWGYGSTVNVKDRLGYWLILASKDIMAADATAARVMNHHVPYIKQLTMGYDMGLGEINEASIEMIGEKLTTIKMDWKPAILKKTIGKKSTGSPIAEQFQYITGSDC